MSIQVANQTDKSKLSYIPGCPRRDGTAYSMVTIQCDNLSTCKVNVFGTVLHASICVNISERTCGKERTNNR